MSATTRTRRPTYATPSRTPYGSRLPGSGHMIHVSTHYAWLPSNPFDLRGPREFRKAGAGYTYRRST